MAQPNRTVQEPSTLYERSLKPRPRVEWASEYVFRPLAHLVVQALLPLRVPPTALVAFHSVLGVIAGVLIGRGDLVLAAILIQIKTVLDNADGQLARASGTVTETGRYMDTEGDLIVNAALFWGVGALTGQWLLALVAFIVLTLLLSADFNFEYLYRQARGEYFRPSPDTSHENQAVLRGLERFYKLFFKPQDDGIRAFSESRFKAISRRYPNATKRDEAKLAYFEADSLFVLANLELSTQLAVLGACLLLGVPALYLWFVIACGAILIGLQVRRERIAARVLAG
jgi:archaetidylinositol phosphate synthase